jgi:hypothetical protein
MTGLTILPADWIALPWAVLMLFLASAILGPMQPV